MKHIKFKKNESIVRNNVSLLIDCDDHNYISYCLTEDMENKGFINPVFNKLKSKKAAIKSCLKFLKKHNTNH